MIFKRLEELNKLITKTVCTTKEKEQIKLQDAFSVFKTLLLQMKNENGVGYIIGNGGSAGIASHFCTDLMKTLKLPACTLVDSNLLTCLSNDFGYDKSYSEALKVILKKQDILIAISSSGNSLNIVNAAKIAKEKKTKVITLSGFSELNSLRKLGDLNFWLNKIDYGLVEMGHFFILHSVVDLFKKIEELELVSTNNA